MNTTPFSHLDQVRQEKFLALYHWGKSISMVPMKAFHMAKKKTLALYPITKGETFYPITHP